MRTPEDDRASALAEQSEKEVKDLNIREDRANERLVLDEMAEKESAFR